MDIPGLNSQELMERRNRIVPRGVSHATPIFVSRAEGARVWDVDGNAFIDFSGGIGVQNLGHRPASVVSAVKRQLDQYIHTSINVLPYEPYVAVAERLAKMTPGRFPKKVIFLNSGAEAVENAIKIARSHTNRSAVVAFTYGFHGRTLLTMSLTGKVHPYKAGFGPMAPEIYHVPYPYSYRDPLGREKNFGIKAADRLLELFRTEVPADQVAAVIVEPVAGEGGFLVAPPEFLRRLREITEAHGILLIADEIQTGFGRTGSLFASEQSGIEPDLVTLGKSLAAGFPLSAVVGRAEVMDAPGVGGLGGTYGGNPVALAAASAVLQEFEDNPDILLRAQQIGDTVLQRFHEFRERYEFIGDVRGVGAMVAMEFVDDLETKAPAEHLAKQVAQFAYRHGLILMRAGMESHVVRTLMPLVISEEDLEAGLDILDRALFDTACQRSEKSSASV